MLAPNFKLTTVPPVDIAIHMPDDDYFDSSLRSASLVTAALPDWLSSAPTEKQQTELTKFPRTRAHLELEQLVFSNFFESFIDEVVTGANPIDIVKKDPRGIDIGRFMRWIHKNPEKYTEFKDAQKIASELLVYQSDSIAEGLDSPEDIERSKLKLKQNEFKIKNWNKERYGDSKQVDVNVSTVINVRKLIDDREIQLKTLEGEFQLIE